MTKNDIQLDKLLEYLKSLLDIKYKENDTYCRPVLPYKPKVVAEEGQNTDAEHGGHKKKKQDVEFGRRVCQLILGGETGEEESQATINNIFTSEIFLEMQEQWQRADINKKEKKGREMTFKKVSCEPLRLHAHHENNNGEDGEGGGGIGGWLRYLWAVFCRFPAAKL